MHKKFEINRTKIKGGCQSGRQVVTHNSKSDLPLSHNSIKLINVQFTLVNVQFTPVTDQFTIVNI